MRRVRVVSSLSFFDSVMLGIGFIVGSGIFIMPLIAAETSGTYSIVAWVVGGIYQILTGLCFAECAMKIPKVGGLYSYAHKAYGDFTWFFCGWTFWIWIPGDDRSGAMGIGVVPALFPAAILPSDKGHYRRC